MPEYFPENNTPIWSDTEVRSLQKISSSLDNLSTGDRFEISIVMAANNNNSDLFASLDWEEITR